MLAADHAIKDKAAFTAAVRQAIPLAEQGKLVTFGIVPTEANCGYGYIQRGDSIDEGYFVAQFVEKPNKVAAQTYLDRGDYYWNRGMFLIKSSRFLEELTLHRPDIANACTLALKNTTKDLDFIRVDKDAFVACLMTLLIMR